MTAGLLPGRRRVGFGVTMGAPRGRHAPGEEADRAADELDEVVVLLRAGLSWEAAKEEVARRGTAGDRSEMRRRLAHRVEAVLRLCRLAGAPLAPALARQAAVLRARAATERDVDVAAAGPRATARIVGLLPLVGALFAMLLGFDVVGAVVRSSLGWALVVAGGVLMVCGSRWANRLIRASRPDDTDPGLLYDLVAVALCGGLGAEAALRAARESVATSGGGEVEADAEDDIRRLIALVRRSGASLGPLLDAQADVRRRRRATGWRLRAETVSAGLLAPLGLCTLPAFLLLGVVPAVLAVVSSTVT